MFSKPTLLSLLPLLSPASAAFGPSFSTGAVSTGNFIREAVSTLILPALPTNNNGDLSLWVGMGTSNGDLIQSIVDSYQGAAWSLFAYTLVSTSESTQTVVEGKTSEGHEGERVTFTYKFDDASGNYTQTVVANDETVSTLSTSDGEAQGWDSAVECAAEDCGTVPAHSWVDTVITLDSTDAAYIVTVGKGDGVTGDLTTDDGGKTWKVSKISIPEFTFGQSS
ncbi:hypothetical protein K490DRAFT_64006 [Saccharata proteae CBS 121410]|uniref:Uncharacterized protein n=1 Tax=Saccharata proteae CBS 121410 TaxID=1314787 RepID=A0A6A5YAB9_9PEZI|nr:hypothetical protein K490DRAFT_64006 [Saccharata proteae CBS 121410]